MKKIVKKIINKFSPKKIESTQTQGKKKIEIAAQKVSEQFGRALTRLSER